MRLFSPKNGFNIQKVLKNAEMNELPWPPLWHVPSSRKAPRYTGVGVFHRVNASCNCCGDLGQWDKTF